MIKNLYIAIDMWWDNRAPSWFKVLVFRCVGAVITWLSAKLILFCVAKTGVAFDVSSYVAADTVFYLFVLDTIVNVTTKIVDDIRKYSLTLEGMREEKVAEMMGRERPS